MLICSDHTVFSPIFADVPADWGTLSHRTGLIKIDLSG